MSQQNIELVRRAFEAFNAGDLEAAFEAADPGLVLGPADVWETLMGDGANGREAVRRFFAEWRDAFGPYAEVEEQIAAGDMVVTRCRSHAGGDHSGAEEALRFSVVHTIRDGRVVMIEVFTDHRDALDAVGGQENGPDPVPGPGRLDRAPAR